MNTNQYLSIYTGWELKGNNRRTFEYSGTNMTVIHLEEQQKDGSWKEVMRQNLEYDGSNNLLSITCKKL